MIIIDACKNINEKRISLISVALKLDFCLLPCIMLNRLINLSISFAMVAMTLCVRLCCQRSGFSNSRSDKDLVWF